MALLDVSSIQWTIVGALAAGKLAMFTLTAALWWVFDRHQDRWRNASLAAIFVANQNDIAVGLAVIPELFPPKMNPDHPEHFESYLYVAVAINLALVVPIGMVMLSLTDRGPRAQPVLQTLGRVFLNPLVVASLGGILYNVLARYWMWSKMPDALLMPLTMAANAFPCCALFLVGHGMVGQISAITGSEFLKPLSLVMMKLIISPIVFQSAMRLVGGSTANELQFAYIYGTFPPAPSTIVIAAQYSAPVNVLCAAIVLGTAVWGPLCFTGAIIFNTGFNTDVEMWVRTICIASDVASLCALLWFLLGFYVARAWPRYWLIIPLVLCQTAYSSADIACRNHVPGAYHVANVSRLAVTCFSVLQVLECCIDFAISKLCAFTAVGVGLSASVLLAVPFWSSVNTVPAHLDRCWWRWPAQERAELFFHCAMLLLLLTASAWSQIKGMQRGSDFEAPLSHNSLANPSAEASGDRSTAGTINSRRVTLPLLSVVALQMGCHTFLLAGVNKDNTGEGGFAIILMLECIFVCGFGFFVTVIFGASQSLTSIAAAVILSLRRNPAPPVFESLVSGSDPEGAEVAGNHCSRDTNLSQSAVEIASSNISH
eukprot:gnl/MRDRNA2_/MRDRNA2_77913_c0_seq1.p1 gnl/MRDRNA2_/MRDRNA2_77913_c0~~gnl/MRDRNA2_/MRDRNA2_77913_c0_seq1.p1  ORF type:complete len:691 (+),score=74.34 gnl/MRDRNA2_/MRDRNA2_77913_c0_seq1:279-2075(+)